MSGVSEPEHEFSGSPVGVGGDVRDAGGLAQYGVPALCLGKLRLGRCRRWTGERFGSGHDLGLRMVGFLVRSCFGRGRCGLGREGPFEEAEDVADVDGG
jgi:hypothetical protein